MSLTDPGEPPATLTLPEAARRLGVSVKAARRAAKNGELPVIRWGNTYLVLREPFEAMLRGQRGNRERHKLS